MRRVNGFQLLALILACLGAAAWMHSVDFASFASRCGAVALWLTAAGSAVLAMRAAVTGREGATSGPRIDAGLVSSARGLVALASHELRTPLASIRAYAEMLVDGEAADERARQEFYVVIQTETERLSQAVENVLTLASIQSGLRVPDRRPARLRFLLARASEQVKALARAREVTIAIESSAANDQVLADEQLIQRAMVNLLTHSIHGRGRGATLRVTVADGAAEDAVRLQILTEIPDVEPKHPPLALDRSYSGDVSAADEPGLQVVRYVVETAHGGRMLRAPDGRESLGFELLLDRRQSAVEKA